MNIIDFAKDIEARATIHGLNIKEVCKRAGIDYCTFTRWRSGETKNPSFLKVASFGQAMTDIENGV